MNKRPYPEFESYMVFPLAVQLRDRIAEVAYSVRRHLFATKLVYANLPRVHGVLLGTYISNLRGGGHVRQLCHREWRVEVIRDHLISWLRELLRRKAFVEEQFTPLYEVHEPIRSRLLIPEDEWKARLQCQRPQWHRGGRIPYPPGYIDHRYSPGGSRHPDSRPPWR